MNKVLELRKRCNNRIDKLNKAIMSEKAIFNVGLQGVKKKSRKRSSRKRRSRNRRSRKRSSGKRRTRKRNTKRVNRRKRSSLGMSGGAAAGASVADAGDNITNWEDWIISVRTHTFFSDAIYEFSEDKTKEGAFGIIFSNNTDTLIKLVLLGDPEVLLGDHDTDIEILGSGKAFMYIEDWINECKYSKIFSDLNVGPQYYTDNILEPNVINLEKFVPSGTKIGMIKLELLGNYENLRTFIITEPNKAEICGNIRKNLMIMHKNNIGHCDLNLGNILVNRLNNEVKFIDFGQVKSGNFSNHEEIENLNGVFDNEDECNPGIKTEFHAHHNIRGICQVT